MIDFLASMTSVAGALPMIGDADDGYVVKPRARAGFLAARFADRHRRGAVRAAGSRRQGGRARRQDRHLVRRRARRARWRRLKRARPRRLPAAACSSPSPATTCWARRFETPDEVRLLVDAGPLGYLSIAAHGHADALSFVLNVGDREILVDPGTYAYHTDPAWRRYFRSTLRAQHRGHRRRGPVGAGGQFHVDAITRTRAASNSTPAPTGSASSASTTATSGSRTRWCTGARSLFDTRPASSSKSPTCCAATARTRARRAWHFAEDCQVEPRWRGTATSPPASRRSSSSRWKRCEQRGNPPRRQRRRRAAGFRAASAASSRTTTVLLAFAMSRCHCAAHPHHATRGLAPLASEAAMSAELTCTRW